MSAGIFLERFLLLFLGTLWAMHLLGVPSVFIAGAGALMLAGGAGFNMVSHGKRSNSTARPKYGPH